MTQPIKTKPADDGGSAFPYPNPNYDGNWDDRKSIGGMSLRDWFAGMALSGMTADQTRSGPWDGYAFDAYAAADAMLAFRKANP